MKSKCENEAKKQDAVRDMTHEILIYFKENYVQKDLVERKKQGKKMMVKQATMGMRAHS